MGMKMVVAADGRRHAHVGSMCRQKGDSGGSLLARAQNVLCSDDMPRVCGVCAALKCEKKQPSQPAAGCWPKAAAY